MHMFRFVRLMVLALFVSMVPASSFSAVFISVGFAPPVLPVYQQPVCPVDGWMWTPGYWAYDYNMGDYYWVPGAWVPAPEVGMLWTPGYWGYSGGLYVWNAGYWGPHVGYYGGVNYGFGYMGIGFAGGEWRGGVFAYNTAVMHVDTTIVHTTYIDRTIVERNTVGANSHVAFSGGPGGINHPPSATESSAMHEQHIAATSTQTGHESAAMQDKSAFAKSNGGHPATTAVARPLTPRPTSGGAGQPDRSINYNASKSNTGNVTAQPTPQGNAPGNNEGRTYNASHSNTGNAPAPPPSSKGPGGFSTGTQVHGNAQPAPPPAPRPAPQASPAPQTRPAPQPQSKPAPKPEQKDEKRDDR